MKKKYTKTSTLTKHGKIVHVKVMVLRLGILCRERVKVRALALVYYFDREE